RGAGDLDPEDVRRDLLHHFRGEADRRWLERGVADGLRAERVEPRCQVAVRAVGLYQRGGGLHVGQHLLGRHRDRRRRGDRLGDRRGGRLQPEAAEYLLVELVAALEQL